MELKDYFGCKNIDIVYTRGLWKVHGKGTFTHTKNPMFQIFFSHEKFTLSFPAHSGKYHHRDTFHQDLSSRVPRGWAGLCSWSFMVMTPAAAMEHKPPVSGRPQEEGSTP